MSDTFDTNETNDDIRGSRPISMSTMVKRVKARVRYGDVEQDQKALVFEGEAGCGKTSILKQTFAEMGLQPICVTLGAQQVEELLAAGVKVVEDEDGNPKLLQAVHENVVPTQKHVDSGEYTFKVGKETRTRIPWFFDEIFTGNIAQMNQLRAALTLNQIGSVPVPKEAFIVGTTNPENIVYSSRKSVDAAIMDRCEIVRVELKFAEHQAYLSRLERAGQYPSVCRLFFRMEGNQDLWKLASPRFWHQGFGNVWHELSKAVEAGDMEDDERVTLFRHAIEAHWDEIDKREKMRRKGKASKKLTPETLLSRFLRYVENGDDPKFYPISANTVLSAPADGADAKKKNLELFAHWNEHEGHSFIGVTIQDLGLVVEDIGPETITTQQLKHIVELLNLSSPSVAVQFIRRFYTKATNKEFANRVVSEAKGTRIYDEFISVMKHATKNISAIKEQKEKQKLKKREE